MKSRRIVSTVNLHLRDGPWPLVWRRRLDTNAVRDHRVEELPAIRLKRIFIPRAYNGSFCPPDQVLIAK
jgi:hypothetical protein